MTKSHQRDPTMGRSVGFAVIVSVIALAACRPPTIVRDPVYPPGAPVGGPDQPVPPLPTPGTAPTLPPGTDPSLLPLPTLQADLVAQAGSDTVRFDRDSYVLNEAARATLTKQAAWLQARPTVRARIEGHADVRQTRDYALALGERRASTVRNFLLAQGVAPQQLTAVSWGKERPAVAAVHEATWLQNSRVVTVLTR